MAYVGIRGGQCDHVREYISHKPYFHLAVLTDVTVVIGGNQLSRLQQGQIQPDQSADEVKTDIENLTRFLKLRLPHAKITTLDLLPRRSPHSWFNSRCRIVNKHVTQTNPDHHHASFFASLIVNSRSRHTEKYNPSAEFMGPDGTHFNEAGYNVLRRIVEWLLASRRGLGEALTFIAEGQQISVMMRF